MSYSMCGLFDQGTGTSQKLSVLYRYPLRLSDLIPLKPASFAFIRRHQAQTSPSKHSHRSGKEHHEDWQRHHRRREEKNGQSCLDLPGRSHQANRQRLQYLQKEHQPLRKVNFNALFSQFHAE